MPPKSTLLRFLKFCLTFKHLISIIGISFAYQNSNAAHLKAYNLVDKKSSVAVHMYELENLSISSPLERLIIVKNEILKDELSVEREYFGISESLSTATDFLGRKDKKELKLYSKNLETLFALKLSEFHKKIAKNESLELLQTIPQDRIVTGKIVDSEGLPLTSVTVSIKGETRGVTSDLDGNFQIQANATDVLVFSYIGYKTVEIQANETVINVVLETDVQTIDEVVVTGYQKLSINENTGAVSRVNEETISRKGNATLLQSLEGQIAGLGFISDPTNGGATRFDIRGVTSLEANATPLIVVDGFPMVGSIDDLNPYEIESVHVLKDAAAASIYGARSANGVIVVTTTKGRSGKTQVNYRLQTSFTKEPDLAYRLNRASAGATVDLEERYAIDNSNVTPTGNPFAPLVTNEFILNNPDLYNPLFLLFRQNATSLVHHTYARLNSNEISMNEVQNILNSLRELDNLGQWQENLFTPEIEKQHNLSVSGGSERHLYRASLNFTESEGSRVGSENDRIIFDLVNTLKINDRISIDVAGNLVFRKNKSLPFELGDIRNISPYESIIDEDGNPLPVLYGPNFASVGSSGGISGGKNEFTMRRLVERGYLDETYYPLQELYLITEDEKSFSTRLQSTVNAQIFSSLSGNFSFQYERGSNSEVEIRDGDSRLMRNLINNTAPPDFDGDPEDLRIPYGSRIIEDRGDRESYSMRGQLNFDKTFNHHNLSAILGSEIRHINRTQTTIDQFGYDNSSLIFQPVDKATLSQTFEGSFPSFLTDINGIPFFDDFEDETTRYFSAYSNANYSFKNRYVLAGSIRLDQSNLFGTDPKFRYRPFWSISGKWRLMEEPIFDSQMIDRFDLRVSYGINGNTADGFGPFTVVRPLFVRNILSNRLVTPAINDLRWERTKITNFGADVRMFNARVNLSFDYYVKQTDDLLALDESTPSQGFTSLIYNVANMINKGFEISLQTTNIKTSSFSWQTQINLRHNTNKIQDVYRNPDRNVRSAAGIENYTGFPANSFYGFDYTGLNESGLPIINRLGTTPLILDGAEDPSLSLTFEDLNQYGTVDPVITGAVTNTFNYKNISLSAMFVGSGGHIAIRDSYNGEILYSTGGSQQYIPKDIEFAWENPGDEDATNIPSVTYQNENGLLGYLTPEILKVTQKNIIEGDFLRLREVILSYTIPQHIIGKSFLNNVGFNLRANNILLFKKNDYGIDPEANGVGVRFFKREPSFSFGVNVGF